MDRLLQDLAYAIRGAIRRRGLTLVSALTLATGIGATTAIFSMVDAVLLRPLPYKDPDQLFRVWQAFSEFKEEATLKAGWDRMGVSYPQAAAVAEAIDLVQSAGAYTKPRPATLSGPGGAEVVRLAFTTASLFKTLGLRPFVGRDFIPADEEGVGAPVALLSHPLWLRMFGGSPAILGQTVLVDGQPRTIVGVMPPSLRLLERAGSRDQPFVAPEVWVPVGTASPMARGTYGHGYQLVVRLSPKWDPRAAEHAIVPLLARVKATYSKGRAPGGSLEPLGRYETLESRGALWIMLVSAAVVLVVACGNVGNLMIAGLAPRARELAIRAALGARRSRLLAMLLAESLVVSLAAGVLGLGLAWCLIRAFVPFAPPGVPGIDGVSVDYRAFGFALVLVAASAVLSGLAPSWLASGGHAVASLKVSAPASATGGRVQRTVCVVQVALAVGALGSAALLVQSLARLSAVDPGFEHGGLLTFGVSLPRTSYGDTAARQAFYERLNERLSALPGVRAVTRTSSLPFRPEIITSNPIVAQTPGGPRRVEAERRLVLPNFFEVLGIPISEGEGLTGSAAEGACRMVVSRATVRRLWPEGGALGARVEGWEEVCTVTGIAADVKERSLAAEPLPTFYRLEPDQPSATNVVLKAQVPPESLIPAVRAVAHDLDAAIAVRDPSSQDALIERTLAPNRYRTIPVALFALVTVLLALVGTYGIMAAAVARQRRAIGIRLALGARPGQVIAHVLGITARIAVLGAAIGVAGSVAAGQLGRAFLFGVEPTAPLTHAAAAVAVILLLLVAAAIPARRAAAVDPSRVLRAE